MSNNKNLNIQDAANVDSLKKELDFVELEERLEMVQLTAVAASETRCNGRCDSTPAPKEPAPAEQ